MTNRAPIKLGMYCATVTCCVCKEFKNICETPRNDVCSSWCDESNSLVFDSTTLLHDPMCDVESVESNKFFVWKKNKRRFSLFGQGEEMKNEENAAYANRSQSLNLEHFTFNFRTHSLIFNTTSNTIHLFVKIDLRSSDVNTHALHSFNLFMWFNQTKII